MTEITETIENGERVTRVDGEFFSSSPLTPAETVLAAVQTARAEVAGYAANNGTRQAVEALANAVEALVSPET